MRKIGDQVIFSRKSPISHAYQSPTCNTCKSHIDDQTYRFLIVKNQYMKHEVLSYHYFFPCWDIDYIFQNLVGCEIFKAGFSCDASIKKNSKYVNNLRKNGELWDIKEEGIKA
jgi:hypothetical protein